MNDLTPLPPLAYLLLPILLMMSKSSQQRERLLKRAELTMQQREHKRELKALKRQLLKEARLYLRLMQDRLAFLGLAFLPQAAHIATEGKVPKKRKVRKVPFSYVYYSSECIWYKVEVSKVQLIGTKNALPYAVRTADVISPETLFELSMGLERSITQVSPPERGAWLIVHRTAGTSGLPNYISFNDAMLHYPDDPIRGTLILGSGQNRTIHAVDLDNFPHVLVAGTTGGGKSNMVNNLICQLTLMNTPEELRLILVDLKRVEFTFYAELPHLLNPFDTGRSIIIDAERTVDGLQYLYDELERRTNLFEGKAKKLSEWNELFPDQKLPRLMMVIDEWSVLVLGRDKIGKQIAAAITNLTIKITSLGRAVGIHLMIATQRPDARVLDPLIRMNMSLTIAGSVPTRFQSQAITGTGDAAKLDSHPGRMLYMTGPTVVHLQTPHCTNENVAMSVKIATGRATGLIDLVRTPEGWTPQIRSGALVIYVHDKLQGDLRITYLQETLERFAISHADLRAWYDDLLKQQSIIVDGREFAVEKVGRKLVLSEVGDSTIISDQPLQLPAEAIRRKIEWAWVKDDPPADPIEADIVQEQPPAPKPAPKTQLALPASVPAKIEKHPALLDESDVIDSFIKERCDTTNNKAQTPAAVLYKNFRDFCDRNRFEQTSQRTFGLGLAERGFAKKRDGSGNVRWKGIEIKTDDLKNTNDTNLTNERGLMSA